VISLKRSIRADGRKKRSSDACRTCANDEPAHPTTNINAKSIFHPQDFARILQQKDIGVIRVFIRHKATMQLHA
jgi:hypothetical protein